MLNCDFEANLTTSSGTASANTPKFSGVNARFIFIKFATEGTQFRFQIIDRKDREIYDEKGLESPYREQWTVPLIGIHTVKILEADSDEAVEVLIKVNEGK